MGRSSSTTASTATAEGITVHAVLAYTIDYTLFGDRDGGLREMLARPPSPGRHPERQRQDPTRTTTGTTSSTPMRHVVVVGEDAHIGGTGIVLRDSHLVISPDGSVVFQAGKHPQFFGGGFFTKLCLRRGAQRLHCSTQSPAGGTVPAQANGVWSGRLARLSGGGAIGSTDDPGPGSVSIRDHGMLFVGDAARRSRRRHRPCGAVTGAAAAPTDPP